MLHRSAQEFWKEQSSGTTNQLISVIGSNDGKQLWVVGEKGTLLHYSAQVGRWETQSIGTTNDLYSVSGSNDWAELWAVGANGAIINGARETLRPYVKDVQLLSTLSGAALLVRLSNNGTSAMPPVTLALQGARRHGFDIGIPLKDVSWSRPPEQPNDPWRFEFDPTDIDVDQGTEAHLRILLQQGAYRTYYDVNLTYDRYRWFRSHRAISLAVVGLGALFAALTMLLLFQPLWLLVLYRQLKIYNLVEHIEVPGVGKLLQTLMKVSILPWFITHPRTLRAWVKANRARASGAWTASLKMPATLEHGKPDADVPFVPLPLRMEDVTARTLNQPGAGDFESLFHNTRTIIQIVGPGGGGKTRLAKHIGDLALAGGEPGAFKLCRLPVWIDEDFTDLRPVIKRKINSWFESGEEIEGPFLDALLERGLLLVMVDRVSERAPATQTCLSTVYSSVRSNALLITARRPIHMEVPGTRYIYPQSLDSSTLLNFMTEIIKLSFTDSHGPEAPPFSTLQSQLELGKRLADLISVKSRLGDGSKEIPMLPLPVVLFVSDAVALMKQRRSLDELPNSLPDVYANYLRRINPKVAGIENGMADEDMLRAAKALAKLALGTEYIPKEFTRDQGRQVLKTQVPDLPSAADPLKRLQANGVLISRDLGATTLLRFVFDPVAEFLAAEAYFDACEGQDDCLEKLFSSSKHAQGFQIALLLTVQARRQGGSATAVGGVPN
jgi:hypothetical protein